MSQSGQLFVPQYKFEPVTKLKSGEKQPLIEIKKERNQQTKRNRNTKQSIEHNSVTDPTQTWTGASTCRPRFDTDAVLRNFRSKRDGVEKKGLSLNPEKMKDFNKKRLNLLQLYVPFFLCSPRANLWPSQGFQWIWFAHSQ